MEHLSKFTLKKLETLLSVGIIQKHCFCFTKFCRNHNLKHREEQEQPKKKLKTKSYDGTIKLQRVTVRPVVLVMRFHKEFIKPNRVTSCPVVTFLWWWLYTTYDVRQLSFQHATKCCLQAYKLNEVKICEMIYVQSILIHVLNRFASIVTK